MDSPLRNRGHADYNRCCRSCEDVFDLAFADAPARIVERKRLSRNAFSKCLLMQFGDPLDDFAQILANTPDTRGAA